MYYDSSYLSIRSDMYCSLDITVTLENEHYHGYSKFTRTIQLEDRKEFLLFTEDMSNFSSSRILDVSYGRPYGIILEWWQYFFEGLLFSLLLYYWKLID